jgi:hypothetical protein
MFDGIKHNTMEVLESAAYIALGFIPTLGLLEIAYRFGMKIRRKRRIEEGSSYQQQSHYCQLFSGSKKWIKQTYPSENISVNRP